MRQAVGANWAFNRYCEIRHRLPQYHNADQQPNDPLLVSNLGDLANDFDVFLFDSFGVLNVGHATIEGAPDRVGFLRNLGKKVFVLTNAATSPLRENRIKYLSMGFEFADHEIISSRAVLGTYLESCGKSMVWGVAAPQSSVIDELPCMSCPLDDFEFNTCDGFILLSSADWTEEKQRLLIDALEANPRPVVVGNPDLVAPRKNTFSKEPGFYAHDLADRLDIKPVFFGKPYGNAFDEVFARLNPDQDRSRVLMLGDTLHTDILGGQSAGCKAALVVNHGLMRDMDIPECLIQSGISPDYIMPSI